jgi:hypothetical protein
VSYFHQKITATGIGRYDNVREISVREMDDTIRSISLVSYRIEREIARIVETLMTTLKKVQQLLTLQRLRTLLSFELQAETSRDHPSVEQPSAIYRSTRTAHWWYV